MGFERRMSDPMPYAGSTISPGRVVPLISSYVVGPLGLMHLPRLWLKGLLYAKGALAEDWGFGPGGLDRRIMRHVDVDAHAFIPWLVRTLPTYEECEEWFRKNARALGEEAILASNQDLLTAPLPRGLGPQFRAYLGIDDAALDVGIMLNNLDDWKAVHQQALRWRGAGKWILPAISSTTFGPLGIVHLPRFWLKRLLAAADALPVDYAFVYEPEDDAVLAALGIASKDAEAFICGGMPNYSEFERWIRNAAGNFGKETVTRTNSVLDPKTAGAVDARDRTLLHKAIKERPRGGSMGPVDERGIRSFESAP